MNPSQTQQDKEPPTKQGNGEKPSKSFREAGESKELSLWQEIEQMLRHNKKYWMIPLIVILLAFGVLLILGATSAAPFIYTLF
jgi:hypothetical protein